jgi:hypothetical protein
MQVPAGGGLLGNKGGNECYDAYGKYICAVSHTRTEQGTRTDQISLAQHGHLRFSTSVCLPVSLSLSLSLFLLFFALRPCLSVQAPGQLGNPNGPFTVGNPANNPLNQQNQQNNKDNGPKGPGQP